MWAGLLLRIRKLFTWAHLSSLSHLVILLPDGFRVNHMRFLPIRSTCYRKLWQKKDLISLRYQVHSLKINTLKRQSNYLIWIVQNLPNISGTHIILKMYGLCLQVSEYWPAYCFIYTTNLYLLRRMKRRLVKLFSDEKIRPTSCPFSATLRGETK